MQHFLFVGVLAVILGILVRWGFIHLPHEKWQILASVPRRKLSAATWNGVNLTFYGLISAAAYTFATAVLILMLKSAHISLNGILMLIACILGICIPASKWIARWVEKKTSTFTVSGASFAGILLTPVVVLVINSFFGDRSGSTLPVIVVMAGLATAYATGMRTSDKFISVGPQKNTLPCVPLPDEEIFYKPLATIVEGAKLLKKATGVVSTSRVTHATPAAYLSHSASRNLENDIMEQAVYQNIDVVLGGGKGYLLPKDAKGKRTDGENLLSVLQDHGYQIAETREDLFGVTKGKVFGMFADSHMDAEIDRVQNHPSQPTLREMTEKAIALLSQDKEGFLLMVEGSQIDWACHANDPAHLLSDMLAYEQAVQVALDFARKDGHTLLIALSDHNTGGFSIGNSVTSETYSQMKPEQLLTPFTNMKSSTSEMWRKLKDNKTPENLVRIVQSDWGMVITPDDAAAILKLADGFKEDPHYAIGEFLSAKYTFVGWTTHGHNGGDVPLFAFGPGKPIGLLDAPAIGSICARSMGLNLNRLNQRLFVDASKEFDAITVDTSQPENIIAQIEFQGKTARLPINKNLLEMNGKLYRLEGVVVYAPVTQKVYLPLQAVQLIKGIKKKLPAVI